MSGHGKGCPCYTCDPITERAAGTSAPACSPYIAGVKAFQDGVVRVGDNPHHEDTDEHWRWMNGWVAAAIESRKANAEALPRNEVE